MSKRLRQQAILDIVSRGSVPSQATLAEELKKLGFDVTQATLSRDIAELELVKSKEGYLRPEDASGSGGTAIPDAEGTLRRLVLKVEDAMNLVVIKTPPGSAAPVAIALDDNRFGKVVGTVGGDDTCLVVTKSPEAALEFKDRLLAMIH